MFYKSSLFHLSMNLLKITEIKKFRSLIRSPSVREVVTVGLADLTGMSPDVVAGSTCWVVWQGDEMSSSQPSSQPVSPSPSSASSASTSTMSAMDRAKQMASFDCLVEAVKEAKSQCEIKRIVIGPGRFALPESLILSDVDNLIIQGQGSSYYCWC